MTCPSCGSTMQAIRVEGTLDRFCPPCSEAAIYAQRAAYGRNALPAAICQCPSPISVPDEEGDIHCLKCAKSMVAA